MKKITAYSMLVCSLYCFAGCSGPGVIQKEQKPAWDTETAEIKAAFKKEAALPSGSRIDTLLRNDEKKEILIKLNRRFIEGPIRPETLSGLYCFLQRMLGAEFSSYRLAAEVNGIPVEEFVPNYYRKDPGEKDSSRLETRKPAGIPLKENLSKNLKITEGLSGRNIVIWNSHGWYYSTDDKRWLWQRPRLFCSVEDLVPTSFVLPYLLPMLENAGANAMLTRERDIQNNEVVVDNDSRKSRQGLYLESSEKSWKTGQSKGFAYGKPPYHSGENPFQSGTYRFTMTDTAETASVSWVPNIPEEGDYAVYVSYATEKNSTSDARYRVHHAGGVTEFRVNQKQGGGTWIYLGTFKFKSGLSKAASAVELVNRSAKKGEVLTADAVKFGGGTGLVERGGSSSGRPKWVEGARYWLQYAGMPDSLYNTHNDKDDYTDDYQCRPEYVNWVNGAPDGPNANRGLKGLGIPVDLSLAFHTDAGITAADSSIGTLSIYSLQDYTNAVRYPDGVSRFAGRDLADIMQTQIVNDIRAKYDPKWSRRALEDQKYSESYRQNVPSVLVELLSHQNLEDMKLMLDPRFRFDVARAMYKGMLRFLSSENGTAYRVQPLSPEKFSAILQDNGSLKLSWKGRKDPLEPSAAPETYRVYQRIGDGGFDNGSEVNGQSTLIKDLKEGVIYSFKVTALNKGGESFPTEILSAMKGKKQVLIVNSFDRICGPKAIETPEFSGFLPEFDFGVPDRYQLSYTGAQYDFNPKSQFVTNEAPGWGASFADQEGKVIAGNSFDYPYLHGKSLQALGIGFSSTSASALEDSSVNLDKFDAADFILGKEKLTESQKGLKYKSFEAFPNSIRGVIENYCKKGGKLILTGSYIGSELSVAKKDSSKEHFGKKFLHMSLCSEFASRTGDISPAEGSDIKLQGMKFNTGLSDKTYVVEAPEAINPEQGGSVLLRYADNSFPAAVGYRGKYSVFVAGFPFETIIKDSDRNSLMSQILTYLGL